MWLLIVAVFGLIVGDGLFLYWLAYDFQGIRAVMQDRLALGFIIDAILTLGILAFHFARTPPGRVGWRWFVVLSLVGGLCFGLPFYWWLNKRGRADASVAAT